MKKGRLVWKFNLRPMKRLSSLLRAASKGRPRGVMKVVYYKWGKRYLASMKRRYMRNSRGGGDWPALDARTVSRRRQGSSTILYDTGTLVGALDIGANGNLFKYVRGGVRVGFGGHARHPKGRATIADIGRFHDGGEGNLPERRIIHKPDKILIEGFKKDLKWGLAKMGKGL